MKKKIQFETATQAYIALVRSTERVHRSIAEYLEMISSMDLSKLPQDMQTLFAQEVADTPRRLQGVIEAHQRGLSSLLRILAAQQAQPDPAPASGPN
jgi:hypothetical protein